MGKKPKFSRAQMLEAALALLDESGPSGLSMSAVAKALGAPSGSVYHRFPSRDHLTAELWLETVEDFQSQVLGQLQSLSYEGALAAIQTSLDWTRAKPRRAQLLLVHRRQDLIAGEWPEALAQRGVELGRQLERALSELAEALALERERVVFAVTELFMAGVRRYVAKGQAPPPARDTYVLEAARTLLKPANLATSPASDGDA